MAVWGQVHTITLGILNKNVKAVEECPSAETLASPHWWRKTKRGNGKKEARWEAGWEAVWEAGWDARWEAAWNAGREELPFFKCAHPPPCPRFVPFASSPLRPLGRLHYAPALHCRGAICAWDSLRYVYVHLAVFFLLEVFPLDKQVYFFLDNLVGGRKTGERLFDIVKYLIVE